MSDQPPWSPQQPNQPGGFGPAGQPQPGGFGGPPPGAPGGFGPAGQQPGGYGGPPSGGYGGPPPGAPGGFGPAGQQPPGQPGGFGGQPGGFGGPPPGWQGQPQKKSRTGLVIGLVVLLLVVVGVGGVLAWQFLRGGGDSLAANVPEDALLYVHLNLNPSASNKLGIRSLIEEINDAAGEDVIDFGALLEDAGMESGLDFGEDIDPWLGDQIAVFATDIPATDPDTFETPAPSFGFLIDLDDPDAAAEFIEDEDPIDTWDAGEDRQAWLIDGDLDQPDAIVLAIDGGLLYGGTPDAVRDALDADADQVLTGDERYTEAVAALPDSVLTAWFDAPALVEATSQQALPMIPDGQQVPVSVGFGISFADGAIDMTTVAVNEEGGDAAEPIAEVTLGSLPAGGLFYGRAPDMGRLMASLVETADEAASSFAEELDGEPLPAAERPSAQVDMVLDEEFDTSIEEIAGWLGDVAVMAAYDPGDSSDNAALLIRAGVGDEESATDLLDTAVEIAQLAEADGVDVESGLVEVGDARVEVADGAMSMVFGNPSDDTLGDDEVYQAAIDGLAGEPVAYLDVRAITEAIVAFALPPGSEVDDDQETAVNIAGAFDSLVVTYDVDGDLTRSAMRVGYGSDRGPIELGVEANPPDVDFGPLGNLEDLIDEGGDAVDGMIGGQDPADPTDPVDSGLSPEEELNELDIDLRDAAATMETQFFIDGAYVAPDIEFPVYLPGSSIDAVVAPDAYCLLGFTPSGDALIYDSISQDVSAPTGPASAECDAIVRSQDAPPDTPTPEGEPFAFGDDPALDALHTACEGGDYPACDELFFASPAGSDYELFALTCGNRNDPSADECVTLYGE